MVERTPFMSELKIPVEVAYERELLEMTELVATTPLIVVVRVLPERV